MSTRTRRPFCDPDGTRPWNRAPRFDPAAVRQWAEPLLHRAYAAAPRRPLTGPHSLIPLAGSPEWIALDDRDPRKPAAVVLAALARLEESTPHAIARQVAADWADAQIGHRERARAAATAPDQLPHIAGHQPFCLTAKRKLVSDLPCAHPGCGTLVRFVHPMADELAARLPDTSWVRCTRHDSTTSLAVAA
ncbi:MULTISPECIES: DUF2742 domain-containing protein [Saccharothrix]|uniref:DUF2742 domain-containing protein n=1 Tax=Saccharothrix TaxID=2071 RepID=UPI00093923E7|nr:DUF2742 domain-containing protein [Saccharothrix sp. CB00851]OKI20833.1 hypothetical protein A6A25_37405 [Saccharothrix sp. CB00851]